MTSTPEDRGPYRLAKLYSLGCLSREDLIRELRHWHYVRESRSALPLHEDLVNFVPGSFDEVQAALDDGLMDEAIFGLVLDALRSQ